MSYETIELSKLQVNSANDRHGELEDESSAIAWLFNNREQHMKNLAADIVTQGEIYEPPLVVKRGAKFVIFDGNRRVTCLKILESSRKAPTTELQALFEKLRQQWNGDFPKTILCQVESDADRIDDILFRRHTGTQAGIGQSTWDDRMKRNFIERTGRSKGTSVADEVEKFLADKDKLPAKGQLPRSTLKRLLSSEHFRNRVGISLVGGKFALTHDELVVAGTLQKIAHDLTSRKIVLGDLWDSKRKTEYLNSLDKEGLLPTDADLIPTINPNIDKTKSKVAKKPRKAKNELRKHIIPNVDYEVEWNGKLQRHREIWEELQFRLELKLHPNAVSVLLRVLIELSVKHYIAEEKLQGVYKDDSLANKITKIANKLLADGKIERDYLRDLKKMEQAENLLSVNTLNRYVHSFDLSPSPEHMKAIWDSVSAFIVHCLNTKPN